MKRGCTWERAAFFLFIIMVLSACFCCAAGIMNTHAADSTSLTSPGSISGYTSSAVSGQNRREPFPLPGTYSWTVPADVTKVWITLAAGGSGGPGQPYYYFDDTTAPYAADSCNTKVLARGGYGRWELAVTPGSSVTIIVGNGGAGGTYCYNTCGFGGPCGSGWCRAQPGGNSTASGSFGTITATGGSMSFTAGWYWTVLCYPGGPIPAGGHGGDYYGFPGQPGWAEIEW